MKANGESRWVFQAESEAFGPRKGALRSLPGLGDISLPIFIHEAEAENHPPQSECGESCWHLFLSACQALEDDEVGQGGFAGFAHVSSVWWRPTCASLNRRQTTINQVCQPAIR